MSEEFNNEIIKKWRAKVGVTVTIEKDWCAESLQDNELEARLYDIECKFLGLSLNGIGSNPYYEESGFWCDTLNIEHCDTYQEFVKEINISHIYFLSNTKNVLSQYY